MREKVVIIGGGLGGLLCGAILAKNNFDVTVIDQNKQIGGCLQSFSIEKHLFDSCVHYIGGLDKGNTLYKILDYAEVMDQIILEPYSDIIDVVYLNNDPTPYPIAQGYQNFKNRLLQFFPEAEQSIELYIQKIKDTIDKFPLYKLKNGDPNLKFDTLGISLESELTSIFGNSKLKDVLLGNSLLYAGNKSTTPFYLHALIMNSYIESSYKIKGSSAQIAKALVQTIRKYNGTIIRNEKINAISIIDDKVDHIASGTNTYYGSKFIGAIHPKQIYGMINSNLIKPSTRNRVISYPNSISALMVNIVLNPNSIAFNNYNIYWHKGNPLESIASINENWPNNYAIYFTKQKDNEAYCESLSILTYLDTKKFDDFKSSYHTKSNPSGRTNAYTAYKNKLGQMLIDSVTQHIPNIKDAIVTYNVASPLTFRDYMGTDDGSIYGLIANYQHPMQSLLSVNCKVSNLFFTGQNINIHGILGVSITAVNTCASLLGIETLLNKINNS